MALSVDRFPNKQAPKVPYNILRNPPFCSFASFLIASSTPIISKPDSSRDLTTLMISILSSFKIIYTVLRKAKFERSPEPYIFLWIAASVADAAVVNPNGIKSFLASGLSNVPVFRNVPKSLPKNPPNCTILWNWVFDNFILAKEPFARALWSFENCVLVNKNLCGKLFLSLESLTTFDESFNVTSVPFFIPDFN